MRTQVHKAPGSAQIDRWHILFRTPSINNQCQSVSIIIVLLIQMPINFDHRHNCTIDRDADQCWSILLNTSQCWSALRVILIGTESNIDQYWALIGGVLHFEYEYASGSKMINKIYLIPKSDHKNIQRAFKFYKKVSVGI